MLEERRWRKWLYVTLVVFIEWEMAFAAILAFSYGEVLSAAIPLAAAFLVFLIVAIAFEPRFTGVRWQPSLEFARRARIPLYAAYVVFVGLIVMMAAPLSLRYIRYIRYLNPLAFSVFRVGSVGSIVLTILLGVAFNRWHASLRLIERRGPE
jgi:hypothetical protein